jgi:hypothetical protein
LSNLRFITRKNVDRSELTTKSSTSARTRYYHYGYVRNRRPDRAFRIAWSGRMAKNVHFEERYAAGVLYDRPQSSRF